MFFHLCEEAIHIKHNLNSQYTCIQVKDNGDGGQWDTKNPQTEIMQEQPLVGYELFIFLLALISDNYLKINKM